MPTKIDFTTFSGGVYRRNHLTNPATYTEEQALLTASFIPKTNKILLMGNAVIQTTAETSKIHCRLNGVKVAEALTNSTSPTQTIAYNIATVTPGTECTISLTVGPQSSASKATVLAYQTYGLLAIEIP